MVGRYKIPTEEELDEATPLVSPNLLAGEVYWLSVLHTRDFSPTPVRAKRAADALRSAVNWTGRPVVLWSDNTKGKEAKMVWVEWPQPGVASGRLLRDWAWTP